jgi:hypothetical protein
MVAYSRADPVSVFLLRICLLIQRSTEAIQQHIHR